MSVWRQLKHGLRVLIHRADSDQAVIDEAMKSDPDVVAAQTALNPPGRKH